LPAAEEPEKRRKQSLREFFVVTYFEIPRVGVLWMKIVIKGGFAGNRGKSREIARRSQHGVVFCSQILFSSATVPFRTNFLSLAEFKPDLSWTNLKLPSSATWP